MKTGSMPLAAAMMSASGSLDSAELNSSELSWEVEMLSHARSD